MKLVQQVQLEFRDERSDKVYEVDLCEVRADEFVVNFRYGRKGSILRDGSKTPAPVDREAAERIFAKLVQSKLDKGYRHTGTARPQPAPAAPTPPPPPPTDPRSRAVLERLQASPSRTHPWSIDRILWRAGELSIAAAEPHLLAQLDQPSNQPQLRRYVVAAALGRCGSAASITALEAIHRDPTNRDATRAIAAAALLRIYPSEAQERFRHELAAPLGEELAQLALHGPADTFAATLRRAVHTDQNYELLSISYLLDTKHTRDGVLALCRETPFDSGAYRELRRVFKLAEYRRDAEAFGIFARRIETEDACGYAKWKSYRPKDRFFSKGTKMYLRRRVWRTLRRLAELESEDYAKLAVGLLLQFTDGDASLPRTTHYPERHWGPWGRFWAFNCVLYGSSPRYFADSARRYYRARSENPPEPRPREEAFPELWDRAPLALVHLLHDSSCEVVHRFAAKALRANAAFLAQMELEGVLMLLSRKYDVTAQLGFELAPRHYDALSPSFALLVALATSCHEPARQQGYRWIDHHREAFRSAPGELATLLLSDYPETRRHVANLLCAVQLPQEVAREFLSRVLAAAEGMSAGDEARAADLADALLRGLADHIAGLSIEVVLDLLRSPLGAVQRIAGDIALAQVRAGQPVHSDILYGLLGAAHPEPGAAGLRLLASLTDQDLAQRSELLYSLIRHESPDVRAAAQPLVERVAATDQRFTQSMAELCMGGLRYQAAEGVHDVLFQLLCGGLAGALPNVTKAQVLELLRASHARAHDLGARLLDSNVAPADLSIREIVRLASHEVRAVREAAWRLSEASLDRFQHAMPTATGLLDAKWEDSREFAFGFFREKIAAHLLTPDVLVAICDSVRPDVQAFGRQLITERFRDADGALYLMRLCEHPSEALQLFATNYLTRYATDNPARLQELERYFVSVLSRVNKARVAKIRCIDFLTAEGLASRDAATVVARIFTRQSVTMAIQNKEALIVGMVRLREAYPDLELPIESTAIEHREEGRRAV